MPHRTLTSGCCAALLVVLNAGRARADAPPNDARTNAIAIVPGQTVTGTTAESSFEAGEPLPDGRESTVWYVWTADGPGPWELRVQSTYGYASAAAYELANDGALREVAQAAFQRPETGEDYPSSHGARFYTTAGARLWFQVYSNGWQDFSLTLSPLTGMPAEDAFTSAIALPAAVNNLAIITAQATLEPGEPRTANRWRSSVWRKWTAPAAGYWLLKYEFGPANAGVDVWRGSALAGLTSAVVASADGEPEGGGDLLPSVRVVAQATAGETLLVRVLSSDDAPALLTIKPATPGDMFASPVELGAQESASHTRQLTDAVTMERGEEYFYRGSQWLAWDCPSSGVYKLNVAAPHAASPFGSISGLDPIAAIYRGNHLAFLSTVPPVPLGIVREPVLFRATAGERYRIRAGLTPFGGYTTNHERDDGGVVIGNPSTFTIGPSYIAVSLNKIAVLPPNDDFAAAGDLGNSTDITAEGSNAGATNEPGEPIGSYQAGDSVWHRWTAPASGRYELLHSSDAQLETKIYRGTAMDAFTLLTSGRSFSNTPGGQVRLRFTAAAGEVIHFRIAGNGYGEQGPYSFRLRKLIPPANDMQAAAFPLASTLPVSATGDTTDAGVESPLEYFPNTQSSEEAMSSIWWHWTAPESGWVELRANASLGLMENGSRYSYTFNLSDGTLRFYATAGRWYHFRLARHRDYEGPVTLRLDRVAGLEHTTPQTALDAGTTLRFSTPLTPVLTGTYHTPNTSDTGALWCRWTPAASSWVSVDTSGSDEPSDILVYAAENVTQPIATSGLSFSGQVIRDYNEYFYSYGPAAPNPRAPFDSKILRDTSLAPEVRRALLHVTAGQTYYLKAAAYGGSLTGIRINARPAGAPPSVTASRVRSVNAFGAMFVEVTASVISPNGLVTGSMALPGAQPLGFSDARRISGDAFAGEYRTVQALPVNTSPASLQPRIDLTDTAGGGVTSLDAPATFAPVENQNAAAPDTFGPQLDGVIATPSHVVLDGQDVNVTLQLGISDAGGSGFAEGEVFLPPVTLNYGAPEPNLVRFGPAQRLRGDGSLGIYAVTITIPAATASATQLSCRLCDVAGNPAGQWDAGGRGDVIFVGGLSTWSFNPILSLPLSIEQRRPPDVESPVISEVTADYIASVGANGEVRLGGHLTDAGTGIAGGTVTLADGNGLIETSIAFTSAARVSGTAQDGEYEISVPAPPYGYGGAHWLCWQVHDGAGRGAWQKLIGPVVLPDRSSGDQRRPQLTRFQISPAAVNLLAGPADVTVSLAASDDRPGLTARVRILDSEDRVIAARTFNCATPGMDCTESLTLPRVPTTGPSATARVLVELTDAARRTEIYGRPWHPAWPDAAAAALTLAPSVPDTFTRWSAAWPGLAGFAADARRNTDGDAWPDLMEFAFGTDPSTPEARDPFAARAPHLTLLGPFQYSLADLPQREANWDFNPAPWFSHATDRFVCDDWQLTAQETNDLATWQPLTIPPRGWDIAVGGSIDATVTVQQLWPAADQHHWFRAEVKRQP